LSSRNRLFLALVERLRREYPELLDPTESIIAGHVLVDGVVVTNPRALVARHGTIAVTKRRPLQGTLKLRAALTTFEVSPQGCVAMDIGASTGGFTTALLEAGVQRVYAIDAGFGQLLGSLRQDERVVNLERINLGALTKTTVSESVDLVTIDVSYLALADAVPQLEVVSFAPGAILIALVKPMYELGLSRPPTNASVLKEAVSRAASGIELAPWTIRGQMRSPIRGGRGAIEFILYGQRL
jgi:23S rRNA (cytidine1920-2'-O)/16S rRNA (cytidine1409-2'-O)-methyltransferase